MILQFLLKQKARPEDKPKMQSSCHSKQKSNYSDYVRSNTLWTTVSSMTLSYLRVAVHHSVSVHGHETVLIDLVCILVSLLYCVIFLEEFNSCLKEVQLAVISVFGPGMISRDGVQRQTKQQDRKKQMVFNKHWTDPVWNVVCASECVCPTLPCVCPAAPRLKIIKTLPCWYILHMHTELVCPESRPVGRWAGLAPDWASCAGNSWPGEGGGKHCYLKMTLSGQQRGRADRETGSSTRAQQKFDWKTHRCREQKKKTARSY